MNQSKLVTLLMKSQVNCHHPLNFPVFTASQVPLRSLKLIIKRNKIGIITKNKISPSSWHNIIHISPVVYSSFFVALSY